MASHKYIIGHTGLVDIVSE